MCCYCRQAAQTQGQAKTALTLGHQPTKLSSHLHAMLDSILCCHKVVQG